MPANPFNLDTIRHSTFVTDIVYHDTLDSTNNLALAHPHLPGNPPGQPLLFLAARQTGGRGRGKRTWHADRGSLTFSLLFSHDTPVSPHRLPPLALATAVAVIEAVRHRVPAEFHDTLGLKWPNDVVVGVQKLAGVLVEPAVAHPAVVVGVGVNVNNTLPGELAGRATSLAALNTAAATASGQAASAISLTDCLVNILAQIEQTHCAWESEDPELPGRWQSACRHAGEVIDVDTPQGSVSGLCRGIDPLGRLVLTTDPGRDTRLTSGSIRPSATAGPGR